MLIELLLYLSETRTTNDGHDSTQCTSLRLIEDRKTTAGPFTGIYRRFEVLFNHSIDFLLTSMTTKVGEWATRSILELRLVPGHITHCMRP